MDEATHKKNFKPIILCDMFMDNILSLGRLIPIHVSGGCSDFFYNLSNFRKFPGIKANLEMFFLPNETYKHRNKHFFLPFDKRFTPMEWALFVKDHVYIIAEDPERVQLH
ncbi:MAG: hypothetical protein GY790_22835 [Bacteroidetes bacterium]|nr:hypothetical protein [Bacteroidota bacterium]